MSEYKVLARKYRPQDFSQLKGQDVLVKTLTNAIASKRIHHAYLLTGIRGVGKTTSARIIAKNLNCINGPTISPCGVCNNCVEITNGNHSDVIEFDAASHTGIEDIKIMIDGVKYAPIKARTKVFIVDEVHMLSPKAFNALLKTLEEPPEHMIFIFATTEVKKIPITILSRCQKFYLRPLLEEEITEHIKQISSLEGCQIDEQAAQLIAKKSFGSVRDSMSLLDQAIINSETETSKTITKNIVINMLGITDISDIFDLFELIINGNTKNALEKCESISSKGVDQKSICFDLMFIINQILRKKHNLCIENDEKVSSLSQKISIPVLVRMWQIILKCTSDFAICASQQMALETAIITLSHSSTLPSTAEIIERLKDKDLNSLLNLFDNAKIT